MSESISRSSLPRIRKLLPKNYVDIRYILKPSPITYRNSVQGHNLIKRNDSYKSIRDKIGKSKSKISEDIEGRGINEGSTGFIQFSMKEISSQKYYNPVEPKIRSTDRRKIINSSQNSVELERKKSEQACYKINSNKVIEKFLGKFEGPRGFVRESGEQKKSSSSRSFILKSKLSQHRSIEFENLCIGKDTIQKLVAKNK